jgi:putative phage-type endonuclease
MMQTVFTDREKWLAERRKGIGGSDAAAVLGLNKWKSSYTLWADKTGRLPEQEDNEAMRQGRDLEAYVACRFSGATGKKVRRRNGFIRNPIYPFAHANIDRVIVGESAGLECKTTSVLSVERYKNGEFPEEHYVQCLHYLAVTGFKKWYLAVLVLNQGFMIFEIERNEGEIKALMDAERDFWEKYVLTDKPPPADGSDSTTAAINAVHKTAITGSIDLSSMAETFVEIAILKKEKSDVLTKIEKHYQEIKLAMGENTRAECEAWVANWKPRADGVRVFTIKEK